MTTGEVLRWHFSPRDLAGMAVLFSASCLLLALNLSAEAVERWIDQRWGKE